MSARLHHALRSTALAACVLVHPALQAQTANSSSVGSAPRTEVTPCSDFDRWVNGAWLTRAEIPADRARTGSFDTLRKANDQLLSRALAELATDPARQTTPGLQLLARHYRAGMDGAGIESRGLAPLQPWLDRIARAERQDLPRLMGEMAQLQVNLPLSLGVGTDARDPTRHVLAVGAGGLGLPDRDDYTRTDANSQRIQTAYRRYVQTLLKSAGEAASDEQVAQIVAFEAEMGAAMLDRVQRRNPQLTYNARRAADLRQAGGSGFDAQAWLQGFGLEAAAIDATPFVVGQLAHLDKVLKLAAETPLPLWRAYLKLRLLDSYAEVGPKALADAHFDYRSRAIRGLQAPPNRSERFIALVGGQYGGSPLAETLGELFVSKAFSPQARTRSLQMLDDIKSAMRERIRQLAWMSEPTKLLAIAKLDAMQAQIGAPERWKTWDGLTLSDDNFLGNAVAVARWSSAERLQDLGRPVDRSRWTTSPHIVNAFAAGGNKIVFPAGILQPPFFDENADDATNFGGIGMVIGHEITHHFDDRGRQFDAEGRLHDWWQPQDAAAYKARAERVVALYGGYEPVPGVPINGRLTLGENISDIAGIQIAYDGLLKALARRQQAGEKAALVDGQTPAQRFFTANAIVWRAKTRPEALVDQLRTDSHAPGRWRVLGPMSQMSAFAQAFQCQPGDAMVAADPIVIW